MASLIVAVADNGVIGLNNGLPWRLRNDMLWFKEKTSGNVCIMGRRTYEGMPVPLRGRLTVVVSRSPRLSDISYPTEAPVVWTSSLESAVELPKDHPKWASSETFVCGGAEVYREALVKGLVDTIYMTVVHANPVGDTCFPIDMQAFGSNSEWSVKSSQRFEADDKNEYPHTIKTLVRCGTPAVYSYGNGGW